MDFGAGVEIDFALLVALARDDALPMNEVDVFAVEAHQLADTHSRGGQQVDDGEVAAVAAVVAHDFQMLVRVGFFYGFPDFHLVDAAHRTFHDVVLVFEPGEEGGENAPDVIDGNFGDALVLLIIVEVLAQVVGGDVRNAPVDFVERILQSAAIVGNGFGRATLHAFGGKEGTEQMCVRGFWIFNCFFGYVNIAHRVFQHLMQQEHLFVVERTLHGLFYVVNNVLCHNMYILMNIRNRKRVILKLLLLMCYSFSFYCGRISG